MSRGKSLMPFNVLVLVTFEVPRTWCGGRRYVAVHAELHFVENSENLFAKVIAWFHVIHLAWWLKRSSHFCLGTNVHISISVRIHIDTGFGIVSLPRSIQHLLIMPFAYIYHLTESLCIHPTHTGTIYLFCRYFFSFVCNFSAFFRIAIKTPFVPFALRNCAIHLICICFVVWSFRFTFMASLLFGLNLLFFFIRMWIFGNNEVKRAMVAEQITWYQAKSQHHHMCKNSISPKVT